MLVPQIILVAVPPCQNREGIGQKTSRGN